MREPIMYANVVKRIEGWDPYAKGSYNPGWEYSKTLSEKEARSIGGKYKAEYMATAKGMSELLNDSKYFQAFLVVQNFNFSSYKDQQQPEKVEQKERAERKLREIEEKKGIQGLYYRKKQ